MHKQGLTKKNGKLKKYFKYLKTQRGSFLMMLCLTFSYFMVELIIGYKTNSMALVADSFHMLSDLLSLIIGFTSLVLSQRKENSILLTYGWSRIEVIGAMANCVFLLSLCLSITTEAIQRIIFQETINEPKLILIVGGVGLLINILGILIFQSHNGGFCCKSKKSFKNKNESELLLKENLQNSDLSLQQENQCNKFIIFNYF